MNFLVDVVFPWSPVKIGTPGEVFCLAASRLDLTPGGLVIGLPAASAVNKFNATIFKRPHRRTIMATRRSGLTLCHCLINTSPVTLPCIGSTILRRRLTPVQNTRAGDLYWVWLRAQLDLETSDKVSFWFKVPAMLGHDCRASYTRTRTPWLLGLERLDFHSGSCLNPVNGFCAISMLLTWAPTIQL